MPGPEDHGERAGGLGKLAGSEGKGLGTSGCAQTLPALPAGH